jgi:predicted RNA-binding protein YlqC (UPF0109 family)
MVVHEQSKQISDLIRYIIQEMVDNPEQVNVSIIEGTQSLVIEVSLAKADMGKLIGKRGRNIDAIRTILRAASATAKIRTVLEITE